MKKLFLSFTIAAIALSLSSCNAGDWVKSLVKGGDKGKTLVTVGSETITEGDLEMLGNLNPRIKSQLASEFGRKKILDKLIEQQLLYQASKKEGLDKSDAVKNKIELYKKVIISDEYMNQTLKEKARKNYDENRSDFEKLKLSHIYIKFKGGKKSKVKRSEKEALDLANKLKKKVEGGEDFAKAAKESSEDNLTNKRGGDLGFASKNEQRLTRRGFGPVLEKAFEMKVGEIGGPIKTEKGYHIVTVTKGSELQPFEGAVQGILFKMRGKARGEILAELRNKFKIEYAAAEKKEKKAAKKKGEKPEKKDLKKDEKKEKKKELSEKKKEK